jgi:hypothetical protein
LASKWRIGIEVVDDVLSISHWKPGEGLGPPRICSVPDPRNLLRILSVEAENTWMRRLEGRISTDRVKEIPGTFSISWGDAGRVSKSRKDEVAFLTSGGFSDKEKRILMGLRLLLWPTAFRKSIINQGGSPGLCKCGATQTASHLLNVREYSYAHSEILRAIPGARHAAWVRVLGDWFRSNSMGWKIVLGESVDTHEDFSGSRARIAESILRSTWERGTSPAGYKPDLVVAKGGGQDPLVIRVLDVCGGSPDKLVWEDELKEHLDKLNHMDSSLFESSDVNHPECFALSEKGLTMIPPEHEEKARAVRSLKCIRYRRRYNSFCSLVENVHVGQRPKVSVSPVALSVSGLIPCSTISLLCEFGTPREVKVLCGKLRVETWKCAVQAYNAWRDEI